MPCSSKPGEYLCCEKAHLTSLLAGGQTVILLAVNGKAEAVVSVADPIKPSAKRAVAELKKLGIEAAMPSGDNKAVAERVAKEVGMYRVFAEVLPENKAEYVKKLQAEGKFVTRAGGVNDAPGPGGHWYSPWRRNRCGNRSGKDRVDAV